MSGEVDVPDSEYWYRIEDYVVSAGVNEWGDDLGRGGVEISILRYRVIKHTPKGVWLDVYGGKRFVLDSSVKRFACPTIDEALVSFYARKEKQIAICQWRIEDAKQAIKKGFEMVKKLKQREKIEQ